jgi:diadenosine tetraphosphate (Ap4A) HIT family hydrolase
MPFVLDERLRADTHPLGESDLSLLLLFDDARYPWTILVPRREGLAELFELSAGDARELWEDSLVLGRAMHRAFGAHKLNVGALGNVVRQLHLHHVVRQAGDPAWPGPVWGHSPRVPRADLDRRAVSDRLFAEPGLAARFSRVS